MSGLIQRLRSNNRESFNKTTKLRQLSDTYNNVLSEDEGLEAYKKGLLMAGNAEARIAGSVSDIGSNHGRARFQYSGSKNEVSRIVQSPGKPQEFVSQRVSPIGNKDGPKFIVHDSRNLTDF